MPPLTKILYTRLSMDHGIHWDIVFENGRFGSRFHFRLAVLVGVLDFETPSKQFC